jgi:hypothetical protein
LDDPRHAYEKQDREQDQPALTNPVKEDERKSERRVDGQDIAAVGESMQPADREQDQQAPDEAGPEIGSRASTLGSLHLQRKAEAEHEREDAEPFAAYEDPGQRLQHSVCGPVDVVRLSRRRHEAEILLAEMGDRDSAERKAAQRVDEANALGHDRWISTRTPHSLATASGCAHVGAGRIGRAPSTSSTH